LKASYVSGRSSEPLIGEMIGDKLDRVVAERASTPCLISRHQGLRYTYGKI